MVHKQIRLRTKTKNCPKQKFLCVVALEVVVRIDNSDVSPTTMPRKSNLPYSYSSCWSLWYINKYACALRRKAIYFYGYLIYRSLWCIIQRRMFSGYKASQKIFKISSILRIHIPIRFQKISKLVPFCEYKCPLDFKPSSIILVPGTYDPSGLLQESRALGATSLKRPHLWCMPEMVVPRALDSSRRPEES